jgi:beta-galactosidase
MPGSAVRHAYGKGQAVWIPALIELGAWLGGDSGPLTTLLADLSASVVRDMPFRFAAPQADTVMRVLRSGSSFLTVIANGSLEEKRVRLVVPSGLRPRPIWEEGSRLAKGNTAVLEPRGTLVVLWRP